MFSHAAVTHLKLLHFWCGCHLLQSLCHMHRHHTLPCNGQDSVIPKRINLHLLVYNLWVHKIVHDTLYRILHRRWEFNSCLVWSAYSGVWHSRLYLPVHAFYHYAQVSTMRFGLQLIVLTVCLVIDIRQAVQLQGISNL